MKATKLLEYGHTIGLFTLANMLGIWQDYRYGSAEAYCADAAERWYDSTWTGPIHIVLLIAGLVWYGWLRTQAKKVDA